MGNTGMLQPDVSHLEVITDKRAEELAHLIGLLWDKYGGAGGGSDEDAGHD